MKYFDERQYSKVHTRMAEIGEKMAFFAKSHGHRRKKIQTGTPKGTACLFFFSFFVQNIAYPLLAAKEVGKLEK